MTELKLYHGNTRIGVVSNIAPEDNYEMRGDITVTAAYSRLSARVAATT